MSDIHIRLIIFVVVMLFLTFSGILLVILGFILEAFGMTIEHISNNIKRKLITNYNDFIEKWEAFKVDSNIFEEYSNKFTYLKYDNGVFIANIHITEDLSSNKDFEIVSIRIVRGNKTYESKLWHSTRFMKLKWFKMDRIMMKYFGK